MHSSNPFHRDTFLSEHNKVTQSTPAHTQCTLHLVEIVVISMEANVTINNLTEEVWQLWTRLHFSHILHWIRTFDLQQTFWIRFRGIIHDAVRAAPKVAVLHNNQTWRWHSDIGLTADLLRSRPWSTPHLWQGRETATLAATAIGQPGIQRPHSGDSKLIQSSSKSGGHTDGHATSDS